MHKSNIRCSTGRQITLTWFNMPKKASQASVWHLCSAKKPKNAQVYWCIHSWQLSSVHSLICSRTMSYGWANDPLLISQDTLITQIVIVPIVPSVPKELSISYTIKYLSLVGPARRQSPNTGWDYVTNRAIRESVLKGGPRVRQPELWPNLIPC